MTFLCQGAQHDDDPALQLPHHPPKVIHRVLEGTLGGYVGIALPVTLWGGYRHDFKGCGLYQPLQLITGGGF